jgi:class 3 adenylate cyclase
VIDDVVTAGHCALELQEEMATIRPAEAGLPEFIALRIGGHFGPVFRIADPVLDRTNFIGSHVSLAARIEPVTPEGAVYVTEAFAAALITQPSSGLECEYVGEIPAAKHYGTMRMYLLKRSGPAK